MDLQHYTAHLKEKDEAPAMDLGRLSIARRPALDLASASLRPAIQPPAADGAAGEPFDIDLEALSAFDVPAFLRREG